MKSVSCLFFILLSVLVLPAQEVNIIPQPAYIKVSKEKFRIPKQFEIVYSQDKEKNTAQFLSDHLQTYYSISSVIKHSHAAKKETGTVYLMDAGIATKGHYSLEVAKNGITIMGDAEGMFYGIQSLIQLFPPTPSQQSQLTIPFVKIIDSPRFQYRGMHLDVSRHFSTVAFVKKYIDYLAYHKLNVFHWHLTDDQGWRIEIKKYPRLTSIGGYRNGTIIGRYPGTGNDGIRYGGYYTQEEVKEVVKYAAERFITVIPEIEMPGHASAAIAAYPELSCFPQESTKYPKQCAWSGDTTGKQVQQTWGVFDDVFCGGKDYTFSFLQDVLDEVLPLFPSTYIHVGGDESPKANWKRCPACQKRIKDNNLKDEHELQSYFIQRMEKHLNSKGRILIGWDEILEGGLAPNAVVMSWRGEEGGIAAAKQKHKVIMSPQNPVYFDHTQSEKEDSVTIGGYNPLERVYAYDPIPKEMNQTDEKFVLGAQANLWCEYNKNPKKIEYMVFPRMSALSEVLWSPKQKRNFSSFEMRLPTQFKRYQLWGASFSTAFFDVKSTVVPTEDRKGVYWKIESKIPNDSISFQANSVTSLHKLPLTKRITATGDYGYTLQKKGLQTPLFIQKFKFNKATGKKITLTEPASRKYPGDGPFTLVNGIVNEKGMGKSKEFLGFDGTDCEAVIDFGKEEEFTGIRVYVFEHRDSWIYPPSAVTFYTSNDGRNFTEIKDGESADIASNETVKKIDVFFSKKKARYIKALIKNFGIVPEGNPAAGHKPWLFVHEIEVL